MRKNPLPLLVSVLTLAVAVPALAQEHHGDDHHHPDFHRDYHRVDWHGDIHHFHDYDYGRWRGGHWYHGPHGGRSGWWWTIGTDWYYYPAPVYPYPDPYTPPGIVVTAPAAPIIEVEPSVVYYCPNPVGYYPYVASCFTPWQKVLSAPGTAVVAPSPGAPPPVESAPGGGELSRDADDRYLNNLAAEFQSIDLSSTAARGQMRQVEKKVESFKQQLYTRPYDVMDILRDADSLEHLIAAQREAWPRVLEQPAAPLPR